MNEEFQKELLAILRAMKDGAPDAFNVLVQQRATYCLTVGCSMLGLALLLLSGGLVAMTRMRGCSFSASDYDGPSARFFLVMVGFMAAIGGLILAGHQVTMLAEGFAPLGRVLEALR